MITAWLIVVLTTAQIPDFADTMAKPDFATTMARPVDEPAVECPEDEPTKVEPPKVEPVKPIETQKPARRRVWVRTGWFGRGHWEWR